MKKHTTLLLLLVGLSSFANALDYGSWMTQNFTKLADIPLNQLPLLGSHDSGSYAIKADSQFCRGEAIAGRISMSFEYLENGSKKVNWTKTQSLDLIGQLNSGIRYFDIRVCQYNNQFYTTHYYISDNYNKFLPNISNYLKTHPKELVIFDFDKHLYANSDTGYLYGANMDSFVSLLTKNLGSYIIKTNNAPNLPTITYKDLIKSGNLVLITSNKYLLENHGNIFFDRKQYLDSQWANQPDAELLVNYLESNVIKSWDAPEYKNKIRVLQAQVTMPNDWQMQLWNKQILLNIANKQTNPILIKYLNKNWKQYKFNIIMTDDSNNSKLMQTYVLTNINK